MRGNAFIVAIQAEWCQRRNANLLRRTGCAARYRFDQKARETALPQSVQRVNFHQRHAGRVVYTTNYRGVVAWRERPHDRRLPVVARRNRRGLDLRFLSAGLPVVVLFYCSANTSFDAIFSTSPPFIAVVVRSTRYGVVAVMMHFMQNARSVAGAVI
jgi:hypothetical protein